jgi:hypothetical protein
MKKIKTTPEWISPEAFIAKYKEVLLPVLKRLADR